MRTIAVINTKIDEELTDACEYAKLALEEQDAHRSLAETYYALSQDEMRHSMMLHEQTVKIIEAYREENGDPPAAMQAVYDHLHKLAIEKAERVKRYQALYKENA